SSPPRFGGAAASPLHWLERIRPGGYQPARPATPQRAGAQTPQALPTAGWLGVYRSHLRHRLAEPQPAQYVRSRISDGLKAATPTHGTGLSPTALNPSTLITRSAGRSRTVSTPAGPVSQIRGSRVRAVEGRHPALGSSHLIAEIHRVLATYYDRRTGARPPGVDQAAHALPDVPVRELGRVRPPVWDILVRGSPDLRRLLFLHHAPLTQPKLSTKHRAEQYRSEKLYNVINSDLW